MCNTNLTVDTTKKSWASDDSDNDIKQNRISSIVSDITIDITSDNTECLSSAFSFLKKNDLKKKEQKNIKDFIFTKKIDLENILPEAYLIDRITINSGVWMNIKIRFGLDYVWFIPAIEVVCLCSNKSKKNVENARDFISIKTGEFIDLVKDCVESYNRIS
jgi:hypothetical protein